MKFRFIFFFSLPILFTACDSVDQGSSEGHPVHGAPHGGQLLEVGEHGSGFNLELLLHPDGFLKIYVLDAHAENFVRIPAYSMTFEIQGENNSTKQIICEGIEDPVTGETLGNTSLFTSTERINGLLPFKAVFSQLEILEFDYNGLAFEFAGNPDKSSE